MLFLKPKILVFGVVKIKRKDIYHIELGGITPHMTAEEWDEFVVVIKGAA